jgi:hypothetical protein
MHDVGDVRNEVMNKDILMPYDKVKISNYETPIEVVNRY